MTENNLALPLVLLIDEDLQPVVDLSMFVIELGTSYTFTQNPFANDAPAARRRATVQLKHTNPLWSIMGSDSVLSLSKFGVSTVIEQHPQRWAINGFTSSPWNADPFIGELVLGSPYAVAAETAQAATGV